MTRVSSASLVLALCIPLWTGCGQDAGDDDVSSGVEVSPAGDDDASTGDDDASTGDDDASAGDDDASAGDDDASAGDDDASTGDDDASTGDDDTLEVSPTPSLEQLCHWDGIDATPGPFDAWWQDGAFYEIFVRSFQDSDGDGVGDLQGLISRLDYLNDGDPETTSDLGITGLWLMPVFESPSEHGYDVTDYYTINPDYGTLEDFDTLILEAHRRGIRVILDLTFNHTSSAHAWFTDAASSQTAVHRDWYRWSDTDRGSRWYPSGDAFYYAAFYYTFPDLNYFSADVRAEMASIYDFWLGRDVDGFRLDGVKYLVEDGSATENTDATHCYLEGQRRYFEQYWPDRLLVGEIWDDADVIGSYFGNGQDQLPMAFDFPLADGIINAINDEYPQTLTSALGNLENYYPDATMGAPFLRNHDMDRTGSVLSSLETLKLAAAIQFAVPGTPFVYYGEEIGMTGARGDEANDNARRSPMQWTPDTGAGFTTGTPWYPINPDYLTLNVQLEENDPASLLAWYKKLVRLRLAEDNGALRHSGYNYLSSKPSGMVGFLRGEGDGAVLALFNLKATPLENITIDLEEGTWAGGVDLLSDTAIEGPLADTLTLPSMPGYGAMWIKLSAGEQDGQRMWDRLR